MPSGPERLARAALSMTVSPSARDTYQEIRTRGPIAVWNDLSSGYPLVDAGSLLAGYERDGWRLVCPGDDEWPARLADLDAIAGEHNAGSPVALWVRGPGHLRRLTERSIAIVGSRAATAYGQHVAGELGFGLASWQWTVVSAAAYGIDGVVLRAALRTALVGHRPVVAVMASAADLRHQRELLGEVEQGGVIVCEAPPGHPLTRERSLARHRLIAALASGLVVVEAGLRSDVLRAARTAEALGRVVMAVPGPITSAASAGCHQLLRIRPAVHLVTSAREVETLLDPQSSAGATAPAPREEEV